MAFGLMWSQFTKCRPQFVIFLNPHGVQPLEIILLTKPAPVMFHAFGLCAIGKVEPFLRGVFAESQFFVIVAGVTFEKLLPLCRLLFQARSAGRLFKKSRDICRVYDLTWDLSMRH